MSSIPNVFRKEPQTSFAANSAFTDNSMLQNDSSFGSASESSAHELTSKWGWSNPPRPVIDMAVLSLKLKMMKTGMALTYLNVLTEESLKQLLLEQPEKTKLLEYAAQKNASIRPMIDRILALKTSYAYYETLVGLNMHPCMMDKNVHKKCEDLDAVVLEIEESHPVVVFSSYQTMSTYASAGRELKASDIIRRKAGIEGNKDILVAVGKRDVVIQMLSASKDETGSEHVEISESLWHGSAALDVYQKQLVRMLDYCIEKKVTDISIVPQRTGGARNLMRRFGDLVDMPTKMLSEDEYRNIVNFLMAKSGANPKAVRVFVPTDGQITFRSVAGDVFLRLSFIPLNHPGSEAEMISISIRILPRTDTVIQLEELKIAPFVRSEIATAAKFPQGLILLAGGTNTGKSTTIAGAIGENVKHYGDKRKRISLEQPIERFLPGVLQVNIPERVMKDGNSIDGFGLILRSIKRHDPDVIWVGEIRDQESANVCVASAISGHLVFSTIHANHTLLGYDNLSKMVHADQRFQLIEALSLIVAQRLVKEVCPSCKQIGSPTDSEKQMFANHILRIGVNDAKLPTKVAHAHPEGCDTCGFTGYTGIHPVNEVLPVTYEVKDAMISMLNNENKRKFIEDRRTVTMFDSAMALVTAHKIELESAII